MNNLIALFTIAQTSLLRHKGRTLLSVVGITIGIATVLAIFSTGEGIKYLLESELNAFGTNYIQVEIKVPSTAQASTENATGIGQGVSITTLTLDDAEAIKALDNVTDYYAGVLDQKVVSYQGYDENTFLYGVNAAYIDIDPHEIVQGRFFTDAEDRSLTQVVVLGATKARKIFGEDNPIGKRIRIGRTNFEVIGVLNEKGANLFFDTDDMLYVPIRTVQRKLIGISHVTFIFAQVADNSIADFTKVQIEDIMRERHEISDPIKDDFAVTTFDEGLAILGDVTGAASILLLLIASVSLLVGSVGIMNIMFVSVTERTEEIGLRKAVGATQQAIRRQFLLESMAITLVGGVLGVILGVGIIYGVAFGAQSQGFDWPAIFEVHFFVIALGVSIGVGLLAGYIPAQKAARLDPIEALRK